MVAPDYIFTDLLFPVLVALGATFASYFATKRLKYSQDIDDRDRKRADFLDRSLSDFTKLNGLLSRLVDDPAKHHIFLLENTINSLNVINKIQSYIPDLIIFPDAKFRQDFTEIADSVQALIQEIDYIERQPFRERERLVSVKAEKNREFELLRIEVLKMGIVIDEDLSPNYLTPNPNLEEKAKDAVLKTVSSSVQRLLSEIREQEDNIKRTDDQNKEVRSFLAIRVLDMQNKTKDLIDVLTSLKTKY